MEQKPKDNFRFNFGGLPPNKIWFTSDPHFFHTNIIKYTDRPFDNVGEMNMALVRNWNNTVKDDDLIFCLGDFALGKNQECNDLLQVLNGQKVLIIGNHERTIMKHPANRDMFDGGIYERLEIKVNDDEVSDNFQHLTLSHYPMITWNHSHRGSWQLFGHVHGVLDGNPKLSPNQLDVGVDSHNFTPISYQTVKELITIENINRVKITRVNNHNKDDNSNSNR